MPFNSSINFQNLRPSVVAIIGNEADWRQAEKLTPGEVDFLEIRADLLLEHSENLPDEISHLPLPTILTVRAPAEGGKASPDPAVRAAIYQRFLPQVSAIDLELSSVAELETVLREAQKRDKKCIFSFHHFQDTPPGAALQKMTADAANRGADLFKVATRTDTADQLMNLLHWLDTGKTLPLAGMGMGRLGKISRPLLAQLGSRLNYGFLDAPVVSGQWPAADLRRLIDSLPQ